MATVVDDDKFMAIASVNSICPCQAYVFRIGDCFLISLRIEVTQVYSVNIWKTQSFKDASVVKVQMQDCEYNSDIPFWVILVV